MTRDERGFIRGLAGDGRPLLAFTGLSLVLSGAFALFLSAAGQFLPHDIQFLGMTAEELCEVSDCRVVLFMFHDRVAFGGALMAVGTLYLWLAEFPLRAGRAWAWWLFAVTGVVGFGSFLAYLGYGYLDTWHGVGTLLLLPVYLAGLALTRRLVPKSAGAGALLVPGARVRWASREGAGRLLLLLTAAGMIAGGLTILTVGMTTVFVPQDLTFMGMKAEELRAVNPRLVPLIAHDRAGFGGGIATAGICVLFCVWCGTPSRSLWQALLLAGSVGFAAAIGVHPAVGYNDLLHLAPAVAGALMFLAGLALSYAPMHGGGRELT